MISVVTCWLSHTELLPAYEAAVQGAQVVIVDQASEPEIASALDAMVGRLGNGSLVFHSKENLRFSKGNNVGFEMVAHDTVVFLNNDVRGIGEPANRWLELAEAQIQPGGLYGPTVQVFDVDGEPYCYVEAWCLGVSRETWAGIQFDAERYPYSYAEDVDASWRARLAGCRLYQAKWPIGHIGNVTSKELPGAYDHADANRETFRQRVREWKAQCVA